VPFTRLLPQSRGTVRVLQRALLGRDDPQERQVREARGTGLTAEVAGDAIVVAAPLSSGEATALA